MLKVLIQPEYLAFQIRKIIFQFTVFKVCFIKSCSFIFRWLELFSYESFKVIHCSVINVLCCFQQLWYIIIIICTCQQLFYFIFFDFLVRRKLWYLSQAFLLIKNFLFFEVFVVVHLRQLIYIIKLSFICQQIFSKKFEQLISQMIAEKEGFEPSRRLPDLYP